MRSFLKRKAISLMSWIVETIDAIKERKAATKLNFSSCSISSIFFPFDIILGSQLPFFPTFSNNSDATV